MLLEFVYSVTDPPIKALRRVIPPLRLGSIALDLSFLIVLRRGCLRSLLVVRSAGSSSRCVMGSDRVA